MADESSTTPPEPWGWTRLQRVALAVLVAILLAVLTMSYVRHSAWIDDHAVSVSGEAISLPTSLDPNTATVEELTAIGHLPEKTAQNVVDWRATHASNDGAAVFRSLTDLSPVPGMTKKTLDQLRPILQFPGEGTPASQQ